MSEGRKVLYFLGAGASRAAGAFVAVQGRGHVLIPTQREFWGTFLRFCRSRAARADIESCLFRYFLGYARTPARAKPPARARLLAPVDVEEVFTFLSERSKAPSSTPQLKTYVQRIWKGLVREIGGVFARFQPNKSTRSVARRLYKRHIRSYDSVVSFNYDTIFEMSLPRDAQWGYYGLEDVSDKLAILKPHGSVNWELVAGHVTRVGTAGNPIVVAPTHLKFIETSPGAAETAGYLDQAPEVRKVWAEMEREMRAAKLLVFIGYSFPVADLYFSSVLRSVLADRVRAPAVALVNPDAVCIAGRLEARFPIAEVVKYFDLEQFIAAGRQGVKVAVDAARGT